MMISRKDAKSAKKNWKKVSLGDLGEREEGRP
jgi:hypothetical protein